MKSKYIIPIAAAVGIVLVLNFVASTKNPAGVGDAVTAQADATAQPEKVKALNFDSLVNSIKPRLDPQVQANISLLENNIARGRDKTQLIADYEQLGNIWLKADQNAVAAHYIGESGKLENSEKKLNFAARLLSEQLGDKDIMPDFKAWMQQEAISFYSTSLGINPLNDTAKMDLASIYMDANEPVQGVQLLLDVTRRDSTNLPANILLGKLAIQSGQWDKAIERGKIVLRIAPNNVDARLFMGEAYKEQGQKEKAVEMFTEAKKLMNSPSFSKEIDDYIATF